MSLPNYFYLFFLFHYKNILSQIIQKQIFIDYQNNTRCTILTCDGSSNLPFENIAQAIYFIQNENVNADKLIISLKTAIYIREEDLVGKITPDINGIYRIYFPFKQIIIESSLGNSHSFIIQSLKCYFSFMQELDFLNINFKFDLQNNTENETSLFKMESNNILKISNTTFDFYGTLFFKFSFLVTTITSFSPSSLNISILFNGTSFLNSLFNSGIVNFNNNTNNSTVYIENCQIYNYFENSSILLFNILGYNNTISVISTSLLASMSFIFLDKFSNCLLKSLTINDNKLTGGTSLLKFMDFNNITIMNLTINNIFLLNSNSFIFLNSNNFLLIRDIHFNKVNIFEGSTILYAETTNFIEIDYTYFTNLYASKVDYILMFNILNFIKIQNTMFNFFTADNSTGFIYLNTSNMILDNCIFVNFSLSSAAGIQGIIMINIIQYLKISNTVFANTNGNAKGGIIYAVTINTVNLTKIFISNNTFGSASLFYFERLSNITIDELFVNSTHSLDNSDWGNIIALTMNNIFISNSQIYYSTTMGMGTILSCSNLSIIIIVNTTIFNSYNNHSAVFYLQNNNTITIKNVKMLEISGNNRIGFLLESKNTILILDSSFFAFNGYYEYGGLLSALDSNNVTILNCQLINFTSFSGSGLFLLTSNNVLVKNVSVEYHINQNNQYYGGIFAIRKNNTIKIFNSKFSSSVAPNGAAVISSEAFNQIEVISCLFYNMTINSNSSNPHGQGTIIYLNAFNNLNVKWSQFMDSTGEYGGGVFCTQYNFISITGCYFTNIFTRNQSTGVGGWLGNTYVVNDSIFVNNTCTFSGGIFYIDDTSNAYVTNMTCIMSWVWGTGGVFYLSIRSNTHIINSTFLSSKSVLSGGIIYIMRNCNVNIINVTIIDCQSENFGSFVLMIQNNTLNISNCSILNTNISLDGGVFYLFQDNNLFIDKLKITKASSSNTDVNGGVFYADSDNVLQLENSFFSEIGIVNSGGVAYLNYLNNITCVNITFFNITVFFSGSLFYLSNSNIFFMDHIIGKQFFGESFGAIYMAEKNYGLINNSFFQNSISFKYDGAFFFLKLFNSLEIHHSYFFNSTATGYGGFLYADSNNNIKLLRNYFNRVNAMSGGDFIYISQFNTIYLQDLILSNNKNLEKAKSNMIFLDGNNFMNINNIKFITGTCVGDGCMLYLNRKNKVIIQNFSFQQLQSVNYFSIIDAFSTNFISLKNGNFDLGTSNYSNNQYMVIGNSNLINSSSVTIILTVNVDTIYKSSGNNVYNFNSEHIKSLTSINYYFFSDKPFENLYMQNMQFDFQIGLQMINIYGSNVTVKNCDFIIRFNSISVFQIAFSSLQIRKSSFINKYDFMTQIIKSSDSNIIYADNFAFNLKMNNSDNIFFLDRSLTIILKRNIFLNSHSLDSLFYIAFATTNFSILKFIAIQNVFHNIKGRSFSLKSLTNDSMIMLKENKFKFNIGTNGEGGALYLKTPSIILVNNTFYKCRAMILLNNINPSLITTGAAIFFPDSGNAQTSINLTNNLFDSNLADVGSPIYFDFLNFILNGSANTFINNKASIFGAPLASQAEKIAILPELPEPFLNINFDYQGMKRVISGFQYPNCLFELYLEDVFGSLILNSNQNITLNLTLISSKPDNLDNAISYKVVDGHFCFNGPFTRNQQPIAASFHYKVIYRSSAFDFFLTFRDCILGEKVTDMNECESCEAGTFTFREDYKTPFLCEPCKESDPFICYGGDFVAPKNDYWRLDKFSSNFINCPKIGTCLEDFSNSTETMYTGICQKGYIGALCAACDKTYGKFDKLMCISCDQQSWGFFLVVNLKILFKTVFFIYLIFVGFKMVAKLTLGKPSKKNIMAMGLLKILMFHFQVLSFFPQIPIKLSDQLHNVLSFTFAFLPQVSDVFFFDCYSNFLNELGVAYFILILCPVYIILIFAISLILIYCSQKYKLVCDEIPSLKLKHLIKMLYFIIIVFSFVDISQVYLEMFQCINIGDNNRIMNKLYNDVTVDCDSLKHKFWIYFLAIPIFIILIQTIISLFIQIFLGMRKKDNFDQLQIKYLFGYFYYPYKQDIFYWDFINLAKRESILFIFLYFYEQMIKKNIYPLLIIYFILVGYLGLILRFKPYSEKYSSLNFVEAISAFMLAFNYLIINLYCSYYFSSEFNIDQMTAITIISLIILNILFFFLWGYYFYIHYLKNKIVTLLGKKRKKTHITDYSEKIKNYLKEKNYYYEKNSNPDNQKENKLGLYLNIYKELFELNAIPTKSFQIESPDNINSLLAKKISEKSYHKINSLEHENLLENKHTAILRDFLFDAGHSEMILEVNQLKLNHFEYIIIYKISMKIHRKDVKLEKNAIYLEQSCFISFFFIIKIYLEYLSVKYEADFKIQHQTSSTKISLNLVIKLYDYKKQRIFFYLKEK